VNRDDPLPDHRLTIDQALFAARRLLGQSGIETAALDARILLQWATGLTAEQLVMRGGEELPDDAGKRFEEAIASRRRGMPVSRWMGRREFWGMDLALGPETLDPRPDTETLVAAVLSRLGRMSRPFIRDMGTGTGAILLALLKELPQARGLGSDLSFGALKQARLNAHALGLSGRAGFLLSDWGAVPARRADVLVSNPPYIARGELAGLAADVRHHDPRRALDGGADGLVPYRMLANQLGGLVHSGGLIALEIGYRQGEDVLSILKQAGADVTGRGLGLVYDLAGRPRVVVARAPRR